jgi:hypothetical protein
MTSTYENNQKAHVRDERKPMDHFFNQLAKDLAQSGNRRSLLLFGWLLLATPVVVQGHPCDLALNVHGKTHHDY